MTAELVRTNIDPMLDRRWVACANPNMCQTMASVVGPWLSQHVMTANTQQMVADNTWLTEQLKHFSGPPGMELRTLSVHEFESAADYYAMLIRLPLPDSNDPETIFAVGRLGYSTAPLSHNEDLLKHEVKSLMDALVLHEVKEWMRYDGEHIIDPHPEN